MSRSGGAALACALAVAGEAQAHGFGQRYDLPIPLWLYVTGAGLTVAASFAMIGFFLRFAMASQDGHATDRMQGQVRGAYVPRTILFIARCAGVALYLLVVCAGLFGTQSPLRNIAPVLVWAFWWVGMTYVSALVGNLWALLNPLDALFAWTEALHARLRPGKSLPLGSHYPESLGVWPAVALFIVFLWMEIVWEGSDAPARLAFAVLAYSALAWLGMLLFGRGEWLRRGEAFALVFGIIARFAPLEVRVAGGRIELRLRPYALGLIAREPADRSRVVLVVAMLAAVSFDGLVETPAWAAFADLFASPDAAKTLGLLAAPLLFLSVFLWSCRLTAWCGETRSSQPDRPRSAWHIAGLFVLSLVPIAIAYHLAHYLSFLAMASQYLVALASDPLGLGWNLFGTANRFIRPVIVDARILWHVSVAAIVVGHVAAVYVAHRVALGEFADRRSALRSQVPMLALMVGYTMLSLWIIAQPIVSSRFG